MSARPSPEAPLGVFDSGLGGLTVVRALRETCPQEDIVYLGDTARVPYGTRSAETVIRYALGCARVLTARGVKAIVVACNTVSAVALDMLRVELDLPVLGVIEPGARAAAARTRGGTIAVLGTPATIASGAYQSSLQKLAPGAKVVSRACPLFVPLAEEGWTDGEVPRLVAERYLSDLRRAGVDTVLLGCTHYPLLARAISQVMGPDVAVVDGALATAEAVQQILEQRQIARPEGGTAARHRTLCTDMPERFRGVAERFLGRHLEQVEQVDLAFGPP